MAGNQLGKHWKLSEETKAKMRGNQNSLGHKHTIETRRKMSLAHQNPSQATRAKLAQALQGNKNSLGNKHTAAAKLKMSIAHLGNKSIRGQRRPPETVEKIRRSLIGRKHSLESRKRRSELFKGAKSHFWKGGITPINDLIRESAEYKRWRKAVFKRDNYTCVNCGQKGGYLEADHIMRFSDYPDLRFEISNGRTLCRPCHQQTPTYGTRKITIITNKK